MILQVAGLITCGYIIDKYWDAERREIRRKWLRIMKENSLINEIGHTYKLAKINAAKYGYLLIVAIPDGYSYQELEEKKEVLESNLHGIIEMEHQKFNGWIKIKLYRHPLKDLKYVPQPTKPHELYIGYSHSEHVIVDMNKLPHLLIAGINSSGKTRGLYVILTTLFHNHKENEIEVYMSQIAKTDLFIYRDLKQIKIFARNPEESLKMYRKVFELMNQRQELIEKHLDKGIFNIEDYNNKMKVPLPYVYIISDEFSLYMPDDTDSKADQAIKEQCLDMLKKIIKLGRAYGLFVITALQKTTADQMPTLLKSQMNVKMTYRQTDIYSSRNVIDTDEALELQQREAICIAGQRYHIKTPFIDNTIIQEYIKESKASKSNVIEKNVGLKPLIEDGIIRG